MIFALPLYDDNPIQNPPVVTYALIGMCIGAFLWQLGQDPKIVAYQFGMVPGVLFGYRALSPGLAIIPSWTTILTSMFLHAGWVHLGGNMLFLWIFGNNVEDRFGRLPFIVFYLLGGIAAAFAQVAINPESTDPLIGASGAIAATLGAYLVLYPGARVLSLVFLGFFYQLLEVPAVLILGFWFVLQLIDGLGSLGAQNAQGGVAFFAHVGGFVSGMAVGFVVRVAGGGRPPSRVGQSA